MKKAAIIFFCLFFTQFAAAQGVEFTLNVWPAVISNYYEKPDPAGSSTDIVKGDFPNYIMEAEARIPVLSWLYIGADLKGSIIGSADMFIGDNASLTIGGGMYGFSADIIFRFLSSESIVAEAYGGFSLTGGTKTFTDYTEGGVIVTPGDSGYYTFAMFGPQMGIYAKAGSLGKGIVFFIDGYWSPSYENHAAVQNQTYKEDFANGYRLGITGGAGYDFNEWSIMAGWKYEKLYYYYGPEAEYDLDINFGGPYVRCGYAF